MGNFLGGHIGQFCWVHYGMTHFVIMWHYKSITSHPDSSLTQGDHPAQLWPDFSQHFPIIKLF